MKIILKLLSFLSFMACAFWLFLAMLSVSEKEIAVFVVLIILAIAFGLLGYFLFSKSMPKANSSPVVSAPGSAPEPEPVPKPVPALEPEPKYNPAPQLSTVSTEESPEYKYYEFHVAGVYYRRKDIINDLLSENYEYDMTKKEIIESGMTDQRIYKYDASDSVASLVPEPDNPHDSNAIQVIVDGILVGYVPAQKTNKVKSILEGKDISRIICSIYGGPYKILEDGESSIERGSSDLSAKVIMQYK